MRLARAVGGAKARGLASDRQMRPRPCGSGRAVTEWNVVLGLSGVAWRPGIRVAYQRIALQLRFASAR